MAADKVAASCKTKRVEGWEKEETMVIIWKRGDGTQESPEKIRYWSGREWVCWDGTVRNYVTMQRAMKQALKLQRMGYDVKVIQL